MIFKKKGSRYLEGDDEEEVVQKKTTTRSVLIVVLPIISIALIVAAIYGIITVWGDYGAASGEYDNLNQYVSVTTKPEITEQAEDTEEAEVVIATSEEEVPYFPIIDVDEAGLKAISEDYNCWFYMPLLDLSYPVAHCLDNEYYLHHTLEGNYNSAGCLYIDYINKGDLTDGNTFIYGHNMRDNTMFGSLKRLREEEHLCESNPYIYLYKEGKVYIYVIFSFYVTDTSEYVNDPDGDRFRIIADVETVAQDDAYITYEDYVERANALSEYRPVEIIDFEKQPPLITLSTCHGPYGTPKRFLVHAALVGVYDTKK